MTKEQATREALEKGIRDIVRIPTLSHGILVKLRDVEEVIKEALAHPEQKPNKDGSPCPEFWDWLPKAYDFDGNGAFTKYNMEVAFLAGKQAAQPEQEPVANGKLTVTLQDTPTEVELAQYKRMFEAACADLGAINEALGLDPDDGGAEPILSAIAELKSQPEQEPVAWKLVPIKPTREIENAIGYARNLSASEIWEDALNAVSTPPQRTWVGLTDEEIKTMSGNSLDFRIFKAIADAIEAKLKEKNT